jgi:hypothetical protein
MAPFFLTDLKTVDFYGAMRLVYENTDVTGTLDLE